jgi:hypothetical protein
MDVSHITASAGRYEHPGVEVAAHDADLRRDTGVTRDVRELAGAILLVGSSNWIGWQTVVCAAFV